MSALDFFNNDNDNNDNNYKPFNPRALPDRLFLALRDQVKAPRCRFAITNCTRVCASVCMLAGDLMCVCVCLRERERVREKYLPLLCAYSIDGNKLVMSAVSCDFAPSYATSAVC